jgi:starvation-inducible DNA-binding protein
VRNGSNHPLGSPTIGGTMSTELMDQLNNLIADFTVLYQKLRHYYWNVKGKGFFVLHEKFEEMYTEVGDVIDELAEVTVDLSDLTTSLGAKTPFTIEVKPPTGALLKIERTTPAAIETVMDLK